MKGGARWIRGMRRNLMVELFREFGTLYTNAGYDDTEAAQIREECEETGIPMGYGRVQHTPRQLTRPEAVFQFRTRNH